MVTTQENNSILEAPHRGAKLLPDLAGPWHGRIFHFESVSSTNQWAIENFPMLEHGAVIWTTHQTSGRGRLGRSWITPPNRCLTFSVALRSRRIAEFSPNLGQVAAWAVHQTLAHYDVPARLKWPNDVMVNDRKIAGILVETADPPDSFVLGIGLNVNLTPQDIAAAGLDPIATSMLMESGRRSDVRDVLVHGLAALESTMDRVSQQGLGVLMDAWSKADWLSGHRVEVHGPNGVIQGEYLGLNHQGQLRIQDDQGTVHKLWTGDVERVLT